MLPTSSTRHAGPAKGQRDLDTEATGRQLAIRLGPVDPGPAEDDDHACAGLPRESLGRTGDVLVRP